MKHAKRLFCNVILMTAVSLLMRGVGVGFQIYLSNRVGAEAMGLFALLSGVYGFALTLATSGIHLGVTRLVVEAIGKKEAGRVRRILSRALLYAVFFGTLSSALLISLAEPIGRLWLADLRTVRPLRLLALTLPLIAASSVFNGYFVSLRRVWKNATVQILEQGLKISATCLLLVSLAPRGIEAACTALVLGGAVAEMLSFLIHGTLYCLDKRKSFPKDATLPREREGRRLLSITLPVALTTYLRSGLLTIEHILIPQGLRNSGVSHRDALVAYGSIQSMALPVVLFPAALIQAFAGLLVPEFTECEAEGTERRLQYMIGRAFWLSLLFAIGVAGVLICFSSEIGAMLYPGTDAGKYILCLAPLIPIMYVDTATDAMLKGLGQQVFSMGVNVADAGLSVLLVALLTPRFGIGGYLITIYFSELLNTSASIARLLAITHAKTRLLKWVASPLLSVVGATTAVRLLLVLGGGGGYAVGSCALHVLLVLTLYALLLRLTGGISHEDLCWFSSLLRPKKRKELQRNSRRYCRPENAASSVSDSKEKSATSECGFASGSSCSIGTK